MTRNPTHESDTCSQRKPTKPRIKALVARVDEILKALSPLPDLVQATLVAIDEIGMDATVREIEKFNQARPFLTVAREKLQAALEVKKTGKPFALSGTWARSKKA